MIARARLRKGNTASATGCGRLLAQAIKTARAAGVTGQILTRADSAYYGWAFVGTALRHKTWFSVTARMTPSVTATITGIEATAWKPIEYPRAIFDEDEQRWVSDAEVAEVPFVAFTGRRKNQHVTCRLIVRRVRRHQPDQRRGRTGRTVRRLPPPRLHHQQHTVDGRGRSASPRPRPGRASHRRVEGRPARAPASGKYTANAAWVAAAVIAFNIARVTAVAASMRTARWATLRTKVINIPARIATTGRRLVLYLPTHWPWADGWDLLWPTATGPPTAPTP